jgi:hypothetical protein
VHVYAACLLLKANFGSLMDGLSRERAEMNRTRVRCQIILHRRPGGFTRECLGRGHILNSKGIETQGRIRNESQNLSKRMVNGSGS